MIVVAIIGVLASIAVPAYQDYIARSKFGAALAEVSAGKIPFDVAVVNGSTPSRLDEIQIQETTTNCAMSLLAGGTGLECAIEGGPTIISDKTITLARNEVGAWICTSDALPQHRGPTCDAAAN